MSKVQELISALRAEAVAVDTGTFSLDATQARRRLDQSQYIDRDAYLACIVEGLIGLGASRVAVTSDGPDVIVEAPALALAATAEEFASLYEKPLDDGADDRSYALGRLAVGIHMALGHRGIGRVLLEARRPEGTSLALFAVEADVDLRAGPGAQPGVRVLFDRGLLEELRASLGASGPPELDEVRDACRHCEALVEIEGARISFGMPFVDHGTELAEDGLKVETGVTRTETKPHLVLLSCGVAVEQIPVGDEESVTGFIALAHLDRPARDLSRLQLIRDKRFERAVSIAEEAHRAIVDSPDFESLRNRQPTQHGKHLGELMRPRFPGLWVLWLLIATYTASKTLRLALDWQPGLEHFAGVLTLGVITLIFGSLGAAPLVTRLYRGGGLSGSLLAMFVGLAVAGMLAYLGLLLWAPR